MGYTSDYTIDRFGKYEIQRIFPYETGKIAYFIRYYSKDKNEEFHKISEEDLYILISLSPGFDGKQLREVQEKMQIEYEATQLEKSTDGEIKDIKKRESLKKMVNIFVEKNHFFLTNTPPTLNKKFIFVDDNIHILLWKIYLFFTHSPEGWHENYEIIVSLKEDFIKLLKLLEVKEVDEEYLEIITSFKECLRQLLNSKEEK